MFISYEDSVLEAADENGNLSLINAINLLEEHGFTMDDIYEDPGDVSLIALDERNAIALLNWLGYWYLGPLIAGLFYYLVSSTYVLPARATSTYVLMINC